MISYTFPPYPGIGGRRWAKFAKYLAREGFTIHVICSNNPFQEKSLWIKDIQNNPNIILYELPPFYPVALQIQPEKIFQKINYSFWDRILPLICKGTIYDRAVFWKKQLLLKSKELVLQHNIRNVIVSGAPFNLNYFATMLKNEFPLLNLISDFRDPWTWGHGYSYPSLPSSKKIFEKKKERETLVKSNYITVPAEVMKEHLTKSYPAYEKKIILLPHAFDKDEICKEEKPPSKKLRLIFYGSIYDYLDDYMKAFCEVFINNSDKVQLDFYSDTKRHQKLFESYGLNHVVSYYPPLSSKELFLKFKNYDYVLLMYADYAINYLSTKVFEVIETKTPILYIGKHGYTAEFIMQNKIGVYLSPAEIKNRLQSLIDNKQMPDYNFDFDTSHFSFVHVTQQLVKLFK